MAHVRESGRFFSAKFDFYDNPVPGNGNMAIRSNNEPIRSENSFQLYLKVIVIDKKLAAKGTSDIFAYFMKVKDISPKALVVLSEEDPDIFFSSIKARVKPEGSDFTDFFEKNAGWNPQIALTRIWQVYRSIHSYTQDVVLPIVIPGETTTINHIGSAIIKNGKMVSQIDSDETLLFNMFNGQSGQGKIEVMEHASVMINNTSLRKRSEVVNGSPRLKARMLMRVSVLEVRGQVTLDTIKKELREMIKIRFEKLLVQAQNGKAFDVIVTIQNEGFIKTE